MPTIVTTALTLNPLEVQTIQGFIIENVFKRPDLLALHGIETGVQMKEQIGFATQFGMTGLASDSSCERKESGVESILTEKFWEPVGIEDTIIHCNKSIDKLFKAYANKITKFRDIYEGGSDIEVFFTILFIETMQKTIWRAAWFSDTAVAAANAGTAGLVVADAVAHAPYYSYFDGFWKQIFTGVGAGDVNQVVISENSVVTSKAAQLALAAGAAEAYFSEVIDAADIRLRADESAKLYVSGELYRNYKKGLITISKAYTTNDTQKGLDVVEYQGFEVINMETIWGLESRLHFINNTTDNVYFAPHRIVFTTPENIKIATLNENDFNDLEVIYDPITRTHRIGYGFTLDSKMLQEYMITVAY